MTRSAFAFRDNRGLRASIHRPREDHMLRMPAGVATPTLALSIQQPWAWLIVNGWKDIENRTWRHSHRGGTLIHAGRKFDADARDEMLDGRHPVTGEKLDPVLKDAFDTDLAADSLRTGGIVGMAEFVDCVDAHPSPWFVGPRGFVVTNGRPLPFIPCKGVLGFFRPELPA